MRPGESWLWWQLHDSCDGRPLEENIECLRAAIELYAHVQKTDEMSAACMVDMLDLLLFVSDTGSTKCWKR